ncbi:maleylacetoacetate isomerase [Penicillium lagena]|uniref:maleylacetoacetate isomerase n=1 Tax=Penicillium lagena TaxID=94218 RepID=UPI002541257F|nr:maleylacetoacetate isomerase [Penicillium lagena]KAJ5613051.1 maleylacetoacetate isomerase [Penicillium lagena]
MSSPQVTLYGRYYSDCSARLRLAIQLKDINYKYVAVNDQSAASYTAINPSGSIPTLVIQEPQSEEGAKNKPKIIIRQSLAALEYLEERYPPSARQRGLLPLDTQDRATVRCLMNIIASDIHPLTTARVRRRIYEQFPSPAAEAAAATSNRKWDRFWIGRGFASYESVVQEKCGMYSVGDSITLADVCLLPAVWTAEKYGMSLDEFPTIKRIVDALHCVEAVQRAHWRCQPDTPEEDRIARPTP